MTEQEIIDKLNENNDFFNFGAIEPYKTIINALKKQIAKKPIWIERSFTKFQICPSCSNAEHYKHVWKQEKYCVDCGQKLDWSDEE